MKKRNGKLKYSIAIITVLSIVAFIIVRTNAQKVDEPEKNFEALWQTFNMNYALFDKKNIDWQALHNIYRPQVNSKTTNKELFEIMSKLLEPLNDNHVFLFKKPFKLFSSGILYSVSPSLIHAYRIFHNKPIPKKYFKGSINTTCENAFTYGWLNDSIGYLHISEFGNRDTAALAIDEVINEFKSAKTIIVDVRRNQGGNGVTAQAIANRFADKKRLFMTTEYRNGGNYNDFEPKNYWFIEPSGPIQYLKPVILLTDRFTLSGAENFTLAMRVLPHVTVVGDFTSGCFGNAISGTLPNGWSYQYVNSQTCDYNGICWEGIGIMPDFKLHVMYNKVNPSKDETLEFALSLIKSGNLKLHDKSNSLKRTESLVKILEKNIYDLGTVSAITRFNNDIANDKEGKFYIAYYELMSLGNKLMLTDKVDASILVYDLTANLFPNTSNIYRYQGIAYAKIHKMDEALRSFDKALSISEKKSTGYKVPTNEHLYNIILKSLVLKGYNGMADECRKIQKNFPLTFNEGFLNKLGYKFLNNKCYSEAINIFEFNVELYPNSANVYDSLAEAYMEAGNSEMATENYEKSLTLNPKNDNAVERLKKLKSGV